MIKDPFTQLGSSFGLLLETARVRLLGKADRKQGGPLRLVESQNTHIVFLSTSNGRSRAIVRHSSARSFNKAWTNAAKQIQKEISQQGLQPTMLRAERVVSVRPMAWSELLAEWAETKRNYFRYGLAFNPTLQYAILEQEINANAILYQGGDEAFSRFNEANFKSYIKRRGYPETLIDTVKNFQPDTTVYLFATEGFFISSNDPLPKILGDSAQGVEIANAPVPITNKWASQETLNSGRRHLGSPAPDQILALINSSSAFLARQLKENGQFVYGHFPCFGRPIATYNTLRHASSVYSMLEAWELNKDTKLLNAIRRAVKFLCTAVIRRYRIKDGETLAFNIDINEEIKLGANAVSILALVKYDELTGDTQYRTLMQELAQGIARMQDQQTGQFVHVLNAQDLTVKDPFRIVYYDGEAAFGLMRLYGLTRDERWIRVVERAFEYFLGAEHWRHHDHWLSYCVNELTLYKPEERYFRFGVQNIANYLDFILNRETTYPTLLELSMAFHAMLQRIRTDHPDMLHVLEGLDVDKFYRALHHRASYLLNGFFWPELAMYFAKPDTVVGSFFIRHHAFRVRIDDVEHYLSGYVAYWKMRVTAHSVIPNQPFDSPSERRRDQVLFLHADLREVGNGIEIAGMRRAKLFHKYLGITPSFLVSDYNPNLRKFESAAKADGRLPLEASIFSLYEWLPKMAASGSISPLPQLQTESTNTLQVRDIGCEPVFKRLYLAHEGLRCEEFFGGSGEVWMRQNFSSTTGKTLLSDIEMCGPGGEIIRFTSEELWVAHMIFSNLDPSINWHFVIDKNQKYRGLSKSPLANSFFHTKTAVIHSNHLRLDGSSKFSYRHLFEDENSSDRLVVLTQEQRHDLLTIGVPEGKLLIIPTAYDVPSSVDLDIKKTKPARTVICMARYAPEKQHTLLFQAFAKVVKQIPYAELHTYGTGALASDLREWVVNAGLSENIRVFGHTADISGAYQQADLGVLASKEEGLPLFGLECIAHGLPLISFACKYGPLDLLGGEDAGVLIPPNDGDALADALIQIFREQEKLESLRAGALRSAIRFKESFIAELWRQWWLDVKSLVVDS